MPATAAATQRRSTLKTVRARTAPARMARVMPAATKFRIADSINGTPATSTMGLGTAQPACLRRLPSPAAMLVHLSSHAAHNLYYRVIFVVDVAAVLRAPGGPLIAAREQHMLAVEDDGAHAHPRRVREFARGRRHQTTVSGRGARPARVQWSVVYCSRSSMSASAASSSDRPPGSSVRPCAARKP